MIGRMGIKEVTVGEAKKVKIKEGKRRKHGATTRQFTVLGFLRHAGHKALLECSLF